MSKEKLTAIGSIEVGCLVRVAKRESRDYANGDALT